MNDFALRMVFILALIALCNVVMAQRSELLRPEKKKGRYHFVNFKGKKGFERSFEDADFFVNDRAAVADEGKWGFINKEGETVIPLIYDEVWAFKKDITTVRKGGEYTLISKTGKKIVEQADSIYRRGNYFSIVKGDKEGLVDASGQFLFPVEYDALKGPFQMKENYFILQQGDLSGLAKGSGEWVFPPTYERIDLPYRGEIPIYADGRWGTWKNGVEDWADTSIYFSQPDTGPLYDEKCFLKNEDGPQKKCSDKAIAMQIYKSIRYPVAARENGISGVAVVQFVVDENGEMQDLTLLRDLEGGCGKEAMRVTQTLGKWAKPGIQEGKVVPTVVTLPVVYRLE